ncbi:AbgT family transporter [Pyramidobacter sp. SM-530-WT-4B]|uniref:AbgT family transporter n=1 Tax=Pyramidobacter porci TaxID=2605789 RepID=A0A6L5YA35_9BACT|nr:AbgT family transporter [Pyramidobacter porci]MST55053.1 AbgT family transporter [Pyramidobacter porci]
MEGKTTRKSLTLRFLDKIEVVGNRMPPPMIIFAFLTLLVVVISGIGSVWGWSATGEIFNKATQKIEATTINIVNLCSINGLRYMIGNLTKNFMSYPSLGMMLTMMFGIGIAEYSGWLNGLIRKAVQITPHKLVTPMVVFIGVMSNLAENAGYVLFVPLAGMIFKACNKHPLAGIAAGFAGVSGGFAANLMISSNDAVLSGYSDIAAKIINPNHSVLPSSNYYFMATSVFLLVIVGTFITEKVIIPRLGEYKPNIDPSLSVPSDNIGDNDEKALKIANYVFLGMILFLAVSCIPQTSWLRNPKTGSLIKGSLLLDSIVPLLTILFFVPGFVYGKISGKFKTSRDVYNGFSASIRVLAGFICVSFAASQFTNYFKYSNLGSILSINGAHFLQQLNVGAIPLMIVFILVTGFSNLFMASASAKYAIFAPVFVPMFMTLGISPELTQVAFRIGDSSTNIIAPVLSSLPIILDAMKRYDKDSGLGTLVSCMLPFSIAIMVSWTVMLVVWMLLKLPLGPGAFIYLNAAIS